MIENTHLSDTAGTADTDSNVDESLKQLLNYSTPEYSPFESSTSTPYSSLYLEIILDYKIYNNLHLNFIGIVKNNNSQTADTGESSYHKSTELNSLLQAPQVTNE
ncbi:hypothetical protein C1646_775328 [Rhizophagus diaphanus]|nr:hypothetical protein C1646_775328 [Rhizophagus diaphanus] [Rhizophagus sp. MUCL 43196]